MLQAIKDSELDLESIDTNEVGVIWASGIGGIKTFMDEMKGFVEADYASVQPVFYS
jgi:3-oxoacyl-[acyl-carrier-protein] synthase II